MKKKNFLHLIIIVPLIIFFVAFKISEFSKNNPSTEQVVTNFYSWYTDYKGNALLSGEYGKSEYISKNLIENIENTLSESKGVIGADPFTCSTDKPDDFIASTVSSENKSAKVVLDQFFNEDIKTINIILIQEEGNWMIDEVICSE